MMPQEGFALDLRTAELFFRVCRLYHIDGREDRIALMREIVRRKKALYIRDVAPILASKRVIEIEKKRDKYEN